MIHFDSSFKEQYKDLSVIGEGAAGIVYKALHVVSGKFVAIKFLKNAATSDKETLMRFNQECTIARKLKHKNILGVISHGETGSCPYIVYEFIDGTTLQQLIGANGALTTKRALKIIIALAKGIGFAHKHGVVHRDLKSENILIAKGGVIKIADFGVARAGASKIRTETGVILGTPAYMAPEQIQGYKVTPAADVYSLGIIFYELLTGDLPFIGSSPMETAMLHIRSEVPSLASSIDESFADILDQLIRGRMLSKDVEDRWKNGGAVVSSLAGFVTAAGGSDDGGTFSPQSDEALLPPKEQSSGDNAQPKKVQHSLKSAKGNKEQIESTGKLAASSKKSKTSPSESSAKSGSESSAKSATDSLSKRSKSDFGSVSSLRIKIACAGIFLVCLGLAVSFLLNSDLAVIERTDYSVHELDVKVTAKDAILAWVTKSEMTGSIVIWEGDNKSESTRSIQEFANEGDGLRHKLKISGLSSGLEYIYQFKDPDGHLSFERSFKTDEIKINKVLSRWIGPGKVKLETEINIPLYMKVVVKSGNQRIFEERCSEKQVINTFEIDMPLAEGDLTWSIYFYSSKEKGQPVRFKTKIPIEGFDADIASDMEPFIKAVQTLKISKLLKSLKKGTKKKPAPSQKIDLPAEALTLYASLDEIMTTYKDVLLKRSEYIFSEPTIEASEKYRLFEILRDTQESLRFIESSGYKVLHSVEELFSGDYAQGSRPLINSTRQIPLTFDSHYERFTSITIGKEEGRVPTPLKFAGLNKSLQVELFIAVKGLSKDTLLQVALNNYYIFNFYQNPRFKRTVGTSPRGHLTGQDNSSSPSGVSGSATERGTVSVEASSDSAEPIARFYQKMDPRIFSSGTNIFTYRVLPVGKFSLPELVTVSSAVLRLIREK